jgi:hypothetical protein
MNAPQLKFPGSGLIKTTPAAGVKMDSAQRAALIRKGNELFNSGNVEQAKRVFLTTAYTDGLIRVGDHYYKNQRFLQALQMYVIAPDSGKRDRLVEKMAKVVQNWLAEDLKSRTMEHK